MVGALGAQFISLTRMYKVKVKVKVEWSGWLTGPDGVVMCNLKNTHSNVYAGEFFRNKKSSIPTLRVAY